MKNSFILLLILATLTSGFSNTTITITKTINWADAPVIHNPTENFPLTIWSFESATYSDAHPSLPIFSDRVLVTSSGKAKTRIINAQYESFDKEVSPDDRFLSTDINTNTRVLKDRNQFFLYYNLIPIRKTASGSFERLVSFEMVIDFEERATATQRTDYTYTSELSSGSIFKIAVTTTGIQKIDYNFLKDSLDLDVDNLDPNKIRLLGTGGGMLPELIDDPRYDDFEELTIRVVGDEDNQFNSSDYILFYGEGPDKWYFDENNEYFSRPKNVYSDQNYYFIKVGSENGLRVGNQASIASTEYNTSEYDEFERFEEDKFNLLNESLGAQGSGRHWYGDPFNPTRERSYNFSFPNIVSNSQVDLKVGFVARSKSSSSYRVNIAGNQFSSTVGNVSWSNNERDYAIINTLQETFTTNTNDLSVTINYPAVGDGTNIGWLDYIELNTRNSINKSGDQLSFRDHKTMAFNSSTFQVSNIGANTLVWDISNPLKPVGQTHTKNGSTLTFGANTFETLKEFVVFEPNGNYSSPTFVEAVDNQNIHALENIDLVIVYYNKFEEAVQQLADHRRDFNGLDVALVDIDQVFNEFGGGRRDVTAIRDFAKMLFDRNPDKFKSMLLFGDGSFDFKDKLNQGNNFIPPFETVNSLHPIRAFPSDDFFGLLTEGEGAALIGALDIGVGRIPVRTPFDANLVVQKLIDYDSNPATLGDWRNRLTFNADDEDGDIHLEQSDRLTTKIDNAHPVFNVNKIFFDAYQQVSTSGGARFPKASEAINRDIFKGTLVMNYIGHGGGKGWAQERVLTNDDIASWNNANKLPLLVTATCSFTGYDEASFVTAGEQTLLKENGGVIGLFTTTRAVYSTANDRLTNAVFDTIFQETGQTPLSIGEILRLAKNANSRDTLETNSRKFSLIGDPSMQLAIPKYNVATSKINGVDVSTGVIDTIQALEQVTIEGFVTDYNGTILTDFNGTVQPTIYDKEITASTLGQDSRSSVVNFQLQQNIIFKGNASVTNGAFTFTFVVPKDINYDYGFGKISYYAHDGAQTDARGYFDQFIIGGTNPNALADDQGPLVEVFMNNEDFAFGGLTSESPTLVAKLSDDNGINVVGNSIGHDLTGVLDENTQQTYILNDFYESELDDYTKGEVRFPLFDLAEGIHTIKVKAWDVANNSGEGFTEFVVASNEEIALDYVLNYPNPFTTSTNFQFEHNIKDQGIEVQITIFTVSGKIVKTIDEQLFTDGGRISGINWDGTDDYGGKLAKGVYLYKIKVRSDDLKTSESEFEKLVILK